MQKYKNFQFVHGVVLTLTLLVAGFFAGYGLLSAHKAFADTAQPSTATGSTPTFKASTQEPGAGQYVCGEGADAVHVSINFGCQGKGSALTDATFAIIRVLSAGVGLIIITSIVVAGIQYTSSRGDPGQTSRAIGRIRSSLVAFLIYIFTAAMLDFVIPAGFFK